MIKRNPFDYERVPNSGVFQYFCDVEALKFNTPFHVLLPLFLQAFFY